MGHSWEANHDINHTKGSSFAPAVVLSVVACSTYVAPAASFGPRLCMTTRPPGKIFAGQEHCCQE
jgi:hypothetical protein